MVSVYQALNLRLVATPTTFNGERVNPDVAFLGDIHGFYNRILEYPWKPAPQLVIQVGDFGFFHLPTRRCNVNPPYPVWFIEGNHDSIDECRHLARNFTMRRQIDPAKNIYHAPKGWVEEFDGKVIGFLGGAESVDSHRRVRGANYFPDEGLTVADLYRFNDNLNKLGRKKLDILVTHTPPECIVRSVYGIVNLSGPSSTLVERALDEWRPDLLISGHMHYHYTAGIRGTMCIVLGTNEWFHPSHGFKQIQDGKPDLEKLKGI